MTSLHNVYKHWITMLYTWSYFFLCWLLLKLIKKEPTEHKQWRKIKTKSPSSKNLQNVEVSSFFFVFLQSFPISCNHRYAKICTKKSSWLKFELHRLAKENLVSKQSTKQNLLLSIWSFFLFPYFQLLYFTVVRVIAFSSCLLTPIQSQFFKTLLWYEMVRIVEMLYKKKLNVRIWDDLLLDILH